MTSSKSSQKRTGKGFSDLLEEISGFDLCYQLTYMSATAAAGITRDRTFALARQLPIPPAQYFGDINDLVANLRYNYSDACRMVGERIKPEHMKTFLFRLADALRSGEPLPGFLAREAGVQGEKYANEYERSLESLKKWTDGYTAITVSIALIVIINMVSTMIYEVGASTMIGMVVTAAMSGFVVAWVLYRAAPHEVKNVPLAEGAKEQRLSLKLFRILVPATAVATLALALLGVHWGWIMIVASILLFPLGLVSLLADGKIDRKDAEVSGFFRSLGGAATSRGTTLADALTTIELDAFPTLEPDIRMLGLRLKATGNPELCWRMFGVETGSKLIDQTTDVFFGAIDLGGDPETSGLLASLFAMRTAMLRAKRIGVAATFSYLLMVMHAVLSALMVFLLEIVNQFAAQLEAAMASIEGGEEAANSLALDMFSFGSVRLDFLERMTIGMVLVLALTNALAVVATEGSHLLKVFFWLSILLFVSGVSFLVAPQAVLLVM